MATEEGRDVELLLVEREGGTEFTMASAISGLVTARVISGQVRYQVYGTASQLA